MKKSIVLLELIISLLLFSIIAVGSSKLIFILLKQNKESSFIVENTLVLETTKLFLTKNNNLNKTHLEANSLYFERSLLLEHVSKYEVTKNNLITTIEICIYDDTICQNWKIES